MKKMSKEELIVVRFKKTKSNLNDKSFHEDLLGVWHVIQPPQDYTACGHATDEYDKELKAGHITCPDCIDIIRFYKNLKLRGVKWSGKK